MHDFTRAGDTLTCKKLEIKDPWADEPAIVIEARNGNAFLRMQEYAEAHRSENWFLSIQSNWPEGPSLVFQDARRPAKGAEFRMQLDGSPASPFVRLRDERGTERLLLRRRVVDLGSPDTVLRSSDGAVLIGGD